jgi:hypothetical protein
MQPFVRKREPDLTVNQWVEFSDRYAEDMTRFTPVYDSPKDSDVNSRLSAMPITLFRHPMNYQMDDFNEPLNKVAFHSPRADRPRGRLSVEAQRVNVHRPLARPFGSQYELG